MQHTPFHADELAAQQLAGGGAKGAGIRDVLINQLRTFFPLLPYLFVGVDDADGWPLATILTGAAGFVQSPDATTLRIGALPLADDPAGPNIAVGAGIGLLGLDLSTRRRNRANGRVSGVDEEGFTVTVRQSFGNCPQYIQSRDVEAVSRQPAPREKLNAFDDEARALIARSDTFLVASTSAVRIGDAGGPDVSHRGGRPGFVRIDGSTLTIPDFSGNRYYNTLGNFLGEPRASLLFIDFENGDLLQLQGRAIVDWSGAEAKRIEGAERSWAFETARGWRRRAACPLRWSFTGTAPTTEATGLWRP